MIKVGSHIANKVEELSTELWLQLFRLLLRSCCHCRRRPWTSVAGGGGGGGCIKKEEEERGIQLELSSFKSNQNKVVEKNFYGRKSCKEQNKMAN